MTSSPRQYGGITAMAFVIGTVVGTGIYLQPRQVAKLAPEPWQNLLLWAAGGLFALCGAIAYARLSQVWPESGGAFVYLRNCYGEWVGSLLLAADILLGRPAAVGALATGLGLIWGLDGPRTLGLAIATLVVLTACQLIGRQATGGLQVALTLLQMLPLLVIAGSGASLPSLVPEPASGQPVLWASGFLAVLWAYDGWYNITILGGEVENPEVNLRRSLIGGVLAVTGLYLALNGLLLAKIPRADILAQGLPFTSLLSGWDLSELGALLKVGLSLALLSTLNGVLACGPSMLGAAGLLTAAEADQDERTRTGASMLFSSWCLGLLMLFAGLPSQFALFNQLSEYTSVIVAALSGLTVTCVFRLRARGHRVDTLTTLAAVIFLLIDLVLMVLLAGERPGLAAGGALSVLVAGSALNVLRRRALQEA